MFDHKLTTHQHLAELDELRGGVEERKIVNVTRHKNLPVLAATSVPPLAFDDVGDVL